MARYRCSIEIGSSSLCCRPNTSGATQYIVGCSTTAQRARCGSTRTCHRQHTRGREHGMNDRPAPTRSEAGGRCAEVELAARTCNGDRRGRHRLQRSSRSQRSGAALRRDRKGGCKGTARGDKGRGGTCEGYCGGTGRALRGLLRVLTGCVRCAACARSAIRNAASASSCDGRPEAHTLTHTKAH